MPWSEIRRQTDSCRFVDVKSAIEGAVNLRIVTKVTRLDLAGEKNKIYIPKQKKEVMLSSKNLGILLLITLILMYVPIPFLGIGTHIAAIIILVVAILLLTKGNK
ncbi:hypothetical protein J4410_05225 [Candidatus Woesearchaeota archaeon]|nr:hypothetical protein [Candidatus Woesearchaeota archaeon]